MSDVLQHILNGLLQGCILALIGLGFSLVWGILNIVNLAHAAFIMLAAYLTYFLWSLVGIDPFVTLPITMAVLFAAGYLLQRYVINMVMGASVLATFLLTFGLGAALAAASGTLLSTTSGFAPNGFSSFNVLAFSVVVLGGLGSIPGALLGGLAFGLVYEFAGTYVLSQRDLVIFAMLILVLVIRPTGLLGREGYR